MNSKRYLSVIAIHSSKGKRRWKTNKAFDNRGNEFEKALNFFVSSFSYAKAVIPPWHNANWRVRWMLRLGLGYQQQQRKIDLVSYLIRGSWNARLSTKKQGSLALHTMYYCHYTTVVSSVCSKSIEGKASP